MVWCENVFCVFCVVVWGVGCAVLCEMGRVERPVAWRVVCEMECVVCGTGTVCVVCVVGSTRTEICHKWQNFLDYHFQLTFAGFSR